MIRTAPSYRGARHYGSFLLIFIMALSYAVVAPLVLPAAAGFFVTAWVSRLGGRGRCGLRSGRRARQINQ